MGLLMFWRVERPIVWLWLMVLPLRKVWRTSVLLKARKTWMTLVLMEV